VEWAIGVESNWKLEDLAAKV